MARGKDKPEIAQRLYISPPMSAQCSPQVLGRKGSGKVKQTLFHLLNSNFDPLEIKSQGDTGLSTLKKLTIHTARQSSGGESIQMAGFEGRVMSKAGIHHNGVTEKSKSISAK